MTLTIDATGVLQEENNRIIYKEALLALRRQITLDMTTIRKQKRELKLAQKGEKEEAPDMQARLHSDRQKARARQLISGFFRGKSWGTMEQNHADGDVRLAYFLRFVWFQEVNKEKRLELPEQLIKILGGDR